MLLPWLSPPWPGTTGHDGEVVYYPSESGTGQNGQDYVLSGGGARVAYQPTEEQSETMYVIPGTKR